MNELNSEERISLRTMIAKARVMAGNAVDETTAIQDIDSETALFKEAQAMQPPYDPESLLNYVELIPHLRPCIDSMKANIDATGHTSVLTTSWMANLDSEEARQAIADALIIEHEVALEEEALLGVLDKDKKEEAIDKAEDGYIPTEEEIDVVAKRLERRIRRETYAFDAFFESCCSDSSFPQLREAVRDDIESMGWGCMELTRDRFGRLKRLSYVSAYTVRPVSQSNEVVYVAERDDVTPISEYREIKVPRRFYRYVQIINGKKIYFKSVGDPRVISARTGKMYPSLDAMRAPEGDLCDGGEGPDAEPGNELLWFSPHYAKGPMAPVRWIGNLLAVLGVREADETNYNYLSSNAIPAGMLLVSGGSLPRPQREMVEQQWRNLFTGSKGSGKIVVLEANNKGDKSPNQNSPVPTVTFQSLRDAQQTDALFTEYDQRASDRIGASFRLPPILRGYTPSSLNRATANASIEFAEQQVFSPIRNEFDWIVNKYIIRDLGICYLKFKSNTPETTSSEEITSLISAAAPHGGLTPNEIRAMVGRIINEKMPAIREEWADAPMVLTLSGQLGALTSMADGETETDDRLRKVETILSQVVTQQFKDAGLDYEIKAHLVDGADL